MTNLVDGGDQRKITECPCDTLEGVSLVKFLGHSVVDLLECDLGELVGLHQSSLVPCGLHCD